MAECHHSIVISSPWPPSLIAVAASPLSENSLCRLGFYCPPSSNTSIACYRGAYCPEGSGFPENCPAGTYGGNFSLKSEDECTSCPRGFKCSSGAEEPLECEEGSYQPDPGKSSCKQCELGTFQPEKNGTMCLDCRPGHFCTLTEQFQCDAGTYNEKSRSYEQSDCVPCRRFATSIAGSANRTACECDVQIGVEPIELNKPIYESLCGCPRGQVKLDTFSFPPLVVAECAVHGCPSLRSTT